MKSLALPPLSSSWPKAKPGIPKRHQPPGQGDVCFSGLNHLPGKKSLFKGHKPLLSLTLLAALGIAGYSASSSSSSSSKLNNVESGLPSLTCRISDPFMRFHSDAALIRREIRQGMGLTGKGIPVFFMDVKPSHFEKTKAYVEDSCKGVAPDVTLTGLVDKTVSFKETLKRPFDFRADWALHYMSRTFEQLLQARLESGDKTPWVINASISYSKMTDSRYVLEKLQQEDPKALEAVYGTPDPGVFRHRSTWKIKQDVYQFVRQERIKQQDRVEKALQRYQDVTKRLAESGVFIVVGAGNDHNDTSVIRGSGDEVNYFTLSDYVFSAAASNMNGTPKKRSDDTIADFSSRGNGRYNPTTALPGENIRILDNGTSYSAPQLSGYLALMLEKNPNMTFDQVKDLIAQASVDTAAPPEAEGAGILDPVTLLQLTPKAEKIA